MDCKIQWIVMFLGCVNFFIVNGSHLKNSKNSDFLARNSSQSSIHSTKGKEVEQRAKGKSIDTIYRSIMDRIPSFRGSSSNFGSEKQPPRTQKTSPKNDLKIKKPSVPEHSSNAASDINIFKTEERNKRPEWEDIRTTFYKESIDRYLGSAESPPYGESGTAFDNQEIRDIKLKGKLNDQREINYRNDRDKSESPINEAITTKQTRLGKNSIILEESKDKLYRIKGKGLMRDESVDNIGGTNEIPTIGKSTLKIQIPENVNARRIDENRGKSLERRNSNISFGSSTSNCSNASFLLAKYFGEDDENGDSRVTERQNRKNRKKNNCKKLVPSEEDTKDSPTGIPRYPPRSKMMRSLSKRNSIKNNTRKKENESSLSSSSNSYEEQQLADHPRKTRRRKKYSSDGTSKSGSWRKTASFGSFKYEDPEALLYYADRNDPKAAMFPDSKFDKVYKEHLTNSFKKRSRKSSREGTPDRENPRECSTLPKNLNTFKRFASEENSDQGVNIESDKSFDATNEDIELKRIIITNANKEHSANNIETRDLKKYEIFPNENNEYQNSILENNKIRNLRSEQPTSSKSDIVVEKNDSIRYYSQNPHSSDDVTKSTNSTRSISNGNNTSEDTISINDKIKNPSPIPNKDTGSQIPVSSDNEISILTPYKNHAEQNSVLNYGKKRSPILIPNNDDNSASRDSKMIDRTPIEINSERDSVLTDNIPKNQTPVKIINGEDPRNSNWIDKKVVNSISTPIERKSEENSDDIMTDTTHAPNKGKNLRDSDSSDNEIRHSLPKNHKMPENLTKGDPNWPRVQNIRDDPKFHEFICANILQKCVKNHSAKRLRKAKIIVHPNDEIEVIVEGRAYDYHYIFVPIGWGYYPRLKYDKVRDEDTSNAESSDNDDCCQMCAKAGCRFRLKSPPETNEKLEEGQRKAHETKENIEQNLRDNPSDRNCIYIDPAAMTADLSYGYVQPCDCSEDEFSCSVENWHYIKDSSSEKEEARRKYCDSSEENVVNFPQTLSNTPEKSPNEGTTSSSNDKTAANSANVDYFPENAASSGSESESNGRTRRSDISEENDCGASKSTSEGFVFHILQADSATSEEWPFPSFSNQRQNEEARYFANYYTDTFYPDSNYDYSSEEIFSTDLADGYGGEGFVGGGSSVGEGGYSPSFSTEEEYSEHNTDFEGSTEMENLSETSTDSENESLTIDEDSDTPRDVIKEGVLRSGVTYYYKDPQKKRVDASEGCYLCAEEDVQYAAKSSRCNHLFCRKCMMRLASSKNNNRCPVDRQYIARIYVYKTKSKTIGNKQNERDNSTEREHSSDHSATKDENHNEEF